ncbi:Krueppel-like factor 11 isoform X1 [Syngnathus typhle]|uniref:Krueppel-like factor 11 isoform X1 n=1 Tax=Syngnathus typhle TaxID=161592 RepID=UPI002A69F789|nr:Krueppel-like factor 11 isoform X1 [Syngnathus typhle]
MLLPRQVDLEAAEALVSMSFWGHNSPGPRPLTPNCDSCDSAPSHSLGTPSANEMAALSSLCMTPPRSPILGEANIAASVLSRLPDDSATPTGVVRHTADSLRASPATPRVTPQPSSPTPPVSPPPLVSPLLCQLFPLASFSLLSSAVPQGAVVLVVPPARTPITPGSAKLLPLAPTPDTSPTGSASGDSLRRRNYVCDFQGCRKTYFKSSHLKAHLRTHTEWRPVLPLLDLTLMTTSGLENGRTVFTTVVCFGRREAVQLPLGRLRQKVRPLRRTFPPPPHAHGREEVCVRRVFTSLHAQRSPDQTYTQTLQRQEARRRRRRLLDPCSKLRRSPSCRPHSHLRTMLA